MSLRLRVFFYCLILLFQLASLTSAQSVPFFIPGDDASKTATDFSGLLHRPAGSKGFVKVRDGKFFVGDERLRFWGMNMCFGANFPTHDEADRVAPHLAKLGVNAVRFHHMDMSDAPKGLWMTEPDGSRRLDPQQLDKFDYFIAKLAENGIYSNINLHVSRTLTEAEGYPQLKNGTWWSSSNKWVMYYDPDVQREVKTFCRNLLTRKNKYRGDVRLTDDPAIAIVEMLNENFFSRQGPGLYQVLPPRFKNSFQVAWNDWLLKRYGNDAELRAAWKPKEELGAALFEPAAWVDVVGRWSIAAKGVALEPKFIEGPNEIPGGIRFEPEGVSEQRHEQQLAIHGLSLKKDQPYSVSFWVRADKSRELSVELSTTEGGTWRDLGVFEVFKTGQQWQQFTRTFFAAESVDGQAYLALSFGNDDVPVEFADVRVNAGVAGKELPVAQDLNNKLVDVPDDGFPLAAHADLKEFMIDTERSWITELKQFLIQQCGVKVPITASQENYHGSRVLQDTVDFVDLHNYWHHPLFTSGNEWSPVHYTVGNVPIESYPLQEQWPARSLIIRTGWRYHNMPFTLSEWNHAEPSDVNTGVVMMAAVVGCLQDWDGMYFFDYESSEGEWFRDHFEGFFDFNGQPVKLAVFAAASNIFLRGDLQSLQETRSGTYEERLDGRVCFQYRIGVDFDIDQPDEVVIPDELKFETPTGSVVWDATKPELGYLKMNTPKSRGVWGLIGGRKFEVNGVSFNIKKVDRNYATMLATSLDNQPIEQSKHLLVLASSGAENSGMKWNEDRTSVGKDWGAGPTLVNVVAGSVGLPLKSATVYALDGSGKRVSQVATTKSKAGEIMFQIGPEQKTIWYEVVVE